MVYRLFPDCGSRCKHTCQLIPAAGIPAQPAGSLHGDDAKQRFAHRDYGPKPQEAGSEQVRKWRRGGERGGGAVSFLEPESFSALSF